MNLREFEDTVRTPSVAAAEQVVWLPLRMPGSLVWHDLVAAQGKETSFPGAPKVPVDPIAPERGAHFETILSLKHIQA
jgi:hypothetical protein